jgi:hypothetical protein
MSFTSPLSFIYQHLADVISIALTKTKSELIRKQTNTIKKWIRPRHTGNFLAKEKPQPFRAGAFTFVAYL